jgi:hypothetical protein
MKICALEELKELMACFPDSYLNHNWLNGVKPRVKYMIRINELYYGIVDKKRKLKSGSKNTFCRINPLDRQSWKVKMENQVIVWK